MHQITQTLTQLATDFNHLPPWIGNVQRPLLERFEINMDPKFRNYKIMKWKTLIQQYQQVSVRSYSESSAGIYNSVKWKTFNVASSKTRQPLFNFFYFCLEPEKKYIEIIIKITYYFLRKNNLPRACKKRSCRLTRVKSLKGIIIRLYSPFAKDFQRPWR